MTLRTRLPFCLLAAIIVVAVLMAHSAATAGAPAPGTFVPRNPHGAVAPPPRATGGVRQTLLDEVGRLGRPLSAATIRRWKSELRASAAFANAKNEAGTLGPRPDLARAQLHVWLGEYELAQHEEPELAQWHFQQAQRLSRSNDSLHGLARYDSAIAYFYEGAYKQAVAGFDALLRGGLTGFPRRDGALWLRHATACAGYHDQRAKLGITEPRRLDPECGIAGIALCLRALGRPHDKKLLRSLCRVTGLGSTAQDLVTACGKLGLAAHTVTADEDGLRLLPKPLIASVEHDHFIAVTGADAVGVRYLCSDCGLWPGGERRLTWKQWRAMEATFFLAVCNKNSDIDRTLSGLPREKVARTKSDSIRLASNGGLGAVRLPLSGALTELAAVLRAHVLLVNTPPGSGCGPKPTALRCFQAKCPMDRGGCGATAGDPVNLASGEEEYRPAPDLPVYNPTGPSPVWGRIYDSLRGSADWYESTDFGPGWSHSYNAVIYEPAAQMNIQAVQGVTTTLGPTSNDAPGAGLTWDVVISGGTAASSTTPNGWTATWASGSLTFTPPVTASSAINYELRYRVSMIETHSIGFDVIPAATYPAGVFTGIAVTGTTLPGTGLYWDVLRSGTTIASSDHPNGWVMNGYDAPSNTLSVAMPINTVAASTYTIRVNTAGGKSAAFTVIAHRYQANTNTKYLVLPNGARVAATPPTTGVRIPTLANPTVVCTVDAGSPLQVQWNYDSIDRLGHYTVVFTDGSQWVLKTPQKSTTASGSAMTRGVQTASACYPLSKIFDRVGNGIQVNYGGTSPVGFPLLSTLTQIGSGATLLTIARPANGNGNILSVSDAYGRSVYYHTGNYTDAKSVAYPEVDQVSQVVTTGTVSPPNRYTYTYSGNSDLIEPFLRTITVPSPTGTGNSTATLNYDLYGFVSSIVDGNGYSRVYTAPDGITGSRTKVEMKDAGGTTVLSYIVTYDSAMNETARTDGSNSTIVASAAYSDADDPYRPSSVTDGIGKTTYFDWDAFGNLQSTTSPRSTTTTLTWSYSAFPLGRLMSVQEGTKAATSFTYYEPSGLVNTVTGPSPTGAGTVSSTLTYTSLGNVATIVSPGNNAVSTMTATFGYTTDGMYSQSEALGQPITVTDNLSKISHFRYTSRGQVSSAIDPLANETDYTYNLADQTLTATYPATGQTGVGHGQTVATYVYVGGPMTATTAYDESGALSRQVSQSFGAEGERLSQSGGTEPVTLTYDAAYRLKTLTDGNSHTTTYAYNTAGYLSRITYPGAAFVQFTSYDNAGNLLQRLDTRNTTTNYLYSDTAGALSDIQYPANVAINVHLTYDAYGRPVTMSDGTGSHSYGYDDRDVLTSDQTTYTGLAAKTVSYTYYGDGSRASMVTPAGTFSYSYNGRGELTGLTNPYSESSAWSYLDNGWLHSQTLANGAVSTYTYDAWGAPTDLTTTLGMTTLSQYGSVAYDGVGNTTSVTGAVSGVSSYSGTTSYTYDSKNQLTQEASTRLGGYTNNHAYDSAGNPTTFKGVTHTFNLKNQDNGNSYDPEGNPTTYGGVTSTFDAEDRMKTFGSLLTATYRGDSLRAKKVTASGTTYFLYDGITPVVELDASGNVAAANTYGANGLLSRHTSSGTTQYTFDLQGNVAQRLNGSGTVLSSFMFDAHGVGTSTATPTEPFGYGAQAGYYTDLETGLQCLSWRYYDPAAGRFLTRDPISYAGGINLYGYCGNGPVTWSDPLGLDWRNYAHVGLGIASLIPAVGTIASLTDAAVYASECDWGGAALAAAGAIPVAGTAMVGARLIAKGLTGAKALREVVVVAEEGATVVRIAENAAAGRAFEEGVIGTVRKIGVKMPSGKMRFPDIFNEAGNVIGDVKNGRYVHFSSQLRDYWAFAQANGMEMVLHVGEETRLSSGIPEGIRIIRH